MAKIYAVSLLSGGLDSTVTTAKAKRETDELVALSIIYGQRHEREISAAADVAEAIGVQHKIIALPELANVANYSALTNLGVIVPADRSADEMTEDIPMTYVPMRNSIFLSIAASVLESMALKAIEHFNEKIDTAVIYIGANQLDYSGYPDCRNDYYMAMEPALNLGSKLSTQYDVPIEINRPLINKSKVEIIREGLRLYAPMSLSWSCYMGQEEPCGRCDSCILRDEACKTVANNAGN